MKHKREARARADLKKDTSASHPASMDASRWRTSARDGPASTRAVTAPADATTSTPRRAVGPNRCGRGAAAGSEARAGLTMTIRRQPLAAGVEPPSHDALNACAGV